MSKNNPFIPNPNQTQLQFDFGGTPMPHNAPATGGGGTETFEVDLSDVTSGFVIPDGEYTVKLMDVEQGVSRAENPQYIWSFEVVDSAEHSGWELKVFTALTPAAMWKVAETVEALGIGATGQMVRFKRSDVIGRTCRALVEQQEYNGQVRSQISKLMRL